MTRFLITGGAGFIGSHLSTKLLEQGHQVAIIDDLSTGNFSNIEHLVGDSNFSFSIDTVTNESVLDRLASQSDVIIHLAAAVGVKLIVEKPIHTIETNLKGTEVVLRLALRYRAKVLLASTSEVYGKGFRVPFREGDDVLLGATANNRWAYAASKMMDEFHCLAYYQENQLPVVIFRLFNTIGPRQTGAYGMVVPRFVQQALKNEPITVYGNGNQQRSFTFVRDVVNAIVALSSNSAAVGQVFNIGHGKEISMLELANLVKRMTNSKSEIKLIPYHEAYAKGFEDMDRRVPDISRIAELIGYAPSMDLPQMLEEIIDFERSVLGKL